MSSPERSTMKVTKKRKKIALLASLAVVVLLTAAFTSSVLSGLSNECDWKFFNCSNHQAQNQIDHLCRSYRSGWVVGQYGGLCSDLCGGRVVLERCLANAKHFSKNLVVVAKWTGEEVVLKADALLLPQEKWTTLAAMDEGELTRSLADALFEVMGLEMSQDEAMKAFAGNASGEDRRLSLLAWAGLAQVKACKAGSRVTYGDALKFRVLEQEGLELTPRILGVCGHIYAEEKLSPLPFRSSRRPLLPPPPPIEDDGSGQKEDKEDDEDEILLAELDAALRMFQVVDKLEKGVRGSPLIYCDVKMENFYLKQQQQATTNKGGGGPGVRIVDGDDIHIEEHKKLLHSTHRCTNSVDIWGWGPSHRGCRYRQCWGTCDHRGFCAPFFNSTALQQVCRSVFLGADRNYTMGAYRGLLEAAVARNAALSDAVERCAGDLTGRTDVHLRQELTTLIEGEVGLARGRRWAKTATKS